MKYLILITLLLTSAFSASAQYGGLLVNGAMLGVSALKAHPQKPAEFVTQASYQGHTFAQKRTPTNKLPSKGGSQIATVEQQLTSCYEALQTNPTNPVLGAERENQITVSLNQLTAARPNWSATAYSEELNFYRQEDNRRQRVRNEQERQQAYQRQERERNRRDSLERLALRRTHLIDSTRQAVLAQVRAQADSVAQVQTTARETAQASALNAAAYTAISAPHTTAAHKQPVARKVVVKAKRSTSPMVYYCNSGNVFKYHASPTCRGLSRCGASVVPMSLSSAQQSMDPCKWCY